MLPTFVLVVAITKGVLLQNSRSGNKRITPYKHGNEIFIFIFFNVIIFLKIGCANLDTVPISPLLTYYIFSERPKKYYVEKKSKVVKFTTRSIWTEMPHIFLIFFKIWK